MTACKDFTHSLLEVLRRTANPEQKVLKVVTTKRSDECGQKFGPLMYI